MLNIVYEYRSQCQVLATVGVGGDLFTKDIIMFILSKVICFFTIILLIVIGLIYRAENKFNGRRERHLKKDCLRLFRILPIIFITSLLFTIVFIILPCSY